MVRLVLSVVLAGVLWMGVGSLPAWGQDEDSPPAAHPVVGSWLVGVDVEGAPPLRLPNLASFTTDGVVIVAAPAVLPELPGAATRTLFSSGHGAWEATGAGAADVRFAFLVVDEAGTPASLNVIDGRLEIGDHGETYAGEFTLTIFPAAGGAPSSATGSWRATRIAVGSDTPFPGMEPAATPAA